MRIDRLSWKLGLSVATIVVCALSAAFVLVYRTYYRHLLETVRSNAAVQTRLIRLALEHDMLEKDRALIGRVVTSFTKQVHVQRVMILDRQGRVQISSDPGIGKSHFRFDSPTCQQCHRYPPGERSRTTTLQVDGGTVFRTVEPIPNSPRCHSCHDRKHHMNGVLIVDVPLHGMLGQMERALGTLALGTGAIGLVLLGGIGLAFRRLVMRRLVRFESTARAISEGDLGRRVPVEDNDALTRVELQFNQMADSLSALLGQLREHRANLEKVMNSVDDGMVVIDRSRIIVAVNNALVRRFADNAVRLMGRKCCAAGGGLGFCPDDEQCPAMACFASGRVERSIRTRRAVDGTVRQEEVVASPVHAPDGGITHVVEVWRDITDRRSAEARLADYHRMVALGMLASGFSHEVNTPLASVATCLDGIARLCAGSAGALPAKIRDEVAEYARIAATQVERCGAITQQFLSLARGKTLAKEIVDLRQAAETVARLVAPTAREAAVSVEVEPPADGLPAVLANGSAVQQVLLNLVLNAVSASSTGQTVRIGFRRGEDVEVLVRDEGRGIAPEDLPRVFEPFFSRREQGTGLGLFVSLNFAHDWGGDIRLDSRPGAGTTFTVVFPPPPGANVHA